MIEAKGHLVDMRCWKVLLLLAAGCSTGLPETSGTEAALPPRAPTVAQAPPRESTQAALDFSPAGLGTEEVAAFLRMLQDAVEAGDRARIAAVVAYPLSVRIRGKPTILAGPADFVAHYPEIMNDEVAAVIRSAELTELFVNYQGVRIGRGELWFAGVYGEDRQKYRLQIVAINVP